MSDENSHETTQPQQAKKKTSTKILKWLLAFVLVLIFLIVFLLPAFVSSEKGRKIILSKINDSVDGRIDFAGLSMHWFKGIKVDDFSYRDVSAQTSVDIKQINTKPHYLAILFGSLSFGKTTIDEPTIFINLKPKQIHKTEVSSKKLAGNKESHMPIIPIKRINLAIKNGYLKITDSKADTIELSQINSKVNLLPPPKQTKFDLDMTVIDKDKESKIHTGGWIRPGTTKADKAKLDGQIQCEYDWATLSTLAGPYLPQGLELQGKRKDTVSFSIGPPKGHTENLLVNLSTRGKLGFEQADYMGLSFGPTKLDIQVQEGLLKIAPFSTIVNDGRVNFAGQVDFKQKPTLLKTPGPIQIVKDVQINDETTRRLLTYLNPVFADASKVTGVADFTCESLAIPIGGIGPKHLQIAGTISIKQLNLEASDFLGQILALAHTSPQHLDITVHPTKFVLKKGSLQYDNMQMDIGDNPVNFMDAVVGLDRSYDMTVVLPWTLSGETARVGKETQGERIALRLKTTAGEKPKLDPGRILEKQIKKQLENELRKALDELLK